MNMKLSDYHVITEPFFDQIEERVKRVIFATRTANVRIIDEHTWTILADEKFDELAADILVDFGEIKLIVPTEENELATILAENHAAGTNDDDLYLVVQPTAFCQLGCHYCGQQHTSKMMSYQEQQQFLQRVTKKLQSQKFKSISIGWFGGEPLVGLPVMRTLTPKLQSLAGDFGCSYNAKIVTNGLALTEHIATELVQELGVSFIEVTLDGIAAYHNARRMQKNGLPTFDKIFANVIALAHRTDLNVKIVIRCNVDHENYESVSLLLQQLAEAGIQDKIGFYTAPIHSWGNDAHHGSLTKQEFAAWEITWLGEMIELGFAPGLLPQRKPLVCMAVMPEAELVDAYGNIFNCTEVPYVPTYGTPNEYAIDHLAGKQMPGQRHTLGEFNQRVSQGQYLCSTCPMLPVCGGGCPKSWLEEIPPCPSAKYNIEQRLLLTYALSRIQQPTTTSPLSV
ncbi:radical SAM/SPASM domain-containing protein [Umezakia ovalisporum]|uniref:Radical SAM protein n=2 Tax=Umezakia ovalisporum TaxID=75695 RepID=A0ABT6K1A8_9CYAN|nr:radical SAM protein [Umezakia ovalisporum]MDH6056103.1 radical SAM protein [Umezakia ovalisporum FSS-43]MDH6068288.1 radical SAM protein [Umezakia ovalisporum APH033B]MDH6069857.1 radical SAM protein [Umezakia ovalisporum CobakiLakeA]MDH6073695.1 radical SAM protein [Umezakia ovalisporum CS-1034]MDH6077184.1 radical SAM protein [Umezakia ovalisporum FSS-45]